MSIALNGPVTDRNPPLSGDKNKWKFKNELSTPLHDLRIVVDGPWYANVPDLREVEIRDANGTVVFSQTFDDVLEAHCVFSADVAPGAEFSVTIRTEHEFEADEYVQFIPSEGSGSNVIEYVSPPTEPPTYLEYGPAVLPPGIWQAATLGESLPVPFWTPLTVFNLLRLLRGLIIVPPP